MGISYHSISMAQGKRIHLVINAFPLQDQHQRRGIGRYTQEVINHIIKLVEKKDPVVKNFRFTLVLSQAEVPLSLKEKQFDQLQMWTIPKSIPKRTSTQLLHAFVYLRNSLKRLQEKIKQADEQSVFFLPHHRIWLPTFFDYKVVMVHDLFNIMFKEYSPHRWIAPVKKAEHSYYLRQLKHANLIITNSHETAAQVKRFTTKDKIVQAIPLGLSEVFMKAHRLKKSVRPTKDKYFLYYGGYDKHKNLPTIIATLEEFNKKFKTAVKLVLVGAQDLQSSLPKSSITVCTPSLDDNTLIQYLLNSLGLFRLSRYEGFGLPELEVMALGRPVISSNAGAIPEIVAQHGMLFDPQNPEGILDALKRVYDGKISSTELAETQKYAHTFSWESNVKELLRSITTCIK